MLATILILQAGRYIKIIDFARFSYDIPQKVNKEPTRYALNLYSIQIQIFHSIFRYFRFHFCILVTLSVA